MPKRRGRGSIAVDWTCLPSEVLQLISDLLQRGDIKSASLSCKSWRQALRPLILKALHLVLSETLTSAATARTRHSQGLPDLQRLLRCAAHGSTLALLLSERRWPSRAQMDALLHAISQQPGVRHLCLRLLEEHAPSNLRDGQTFLQVLHALCSTLAADARHVTGLTLQLCPLHPAAQRQVSAALAQLPSLQALTYSPWRLDDTALAPLTALTALTSLCLGRLPDIGSVPTLPQLLQLLSKLSLLQSLTLESFVSREPALVVALPSWPHLRHLHLNGESFHLHNLQLSAEHCARLESLKAQCFHAAEGVTSMAQLTQLDVLCPPGQPAAPAQPGLLQDLGQQLQQAVQQLVALQLQQEQLQLQQQAAGADQQQQVQQLAALQQQAAQLLAQQDQLQQLQQQRLHFPQLQHLLLGRRYARESPEAVADMLAEAPALLELDLSRMSRRLELCELQAVQQQLSKPRPLRSLELSRYSSAVQAQQVQEHILGPAVQAGKLQRLRLYHKLDAQLCSQLKALASLRELELTCSFDAAADAQPLAHLLPQLTELTVGGVPSRLLAGAVKVPPLRSLVLYGASLGSAPGLRTLQLAQLTGLTRLHVSDAEMGAAGGACISRLTGLVELQARIWPGMAQQLAGLQGLRRAKIKVSGVDSLAVLEGQMVQLGRLSQLRELELSTWREGALMKQLVQRLVTMLPRCIVVKSLSIRDHHGMPWAWPLAEGV